MARRKLAVLVAASHFPRAPELQTLRCPPNDVAGLADVLNDPERGGFDDVMTLVDEESPEVSEGINAVLNGAELDDLVLVYYSGHGKLNRRGDLHLATPDTKVESLESTSVPLLNIRNYLRNTPSRSVLLILDCCYSGRVGDLFFKNALEDTVRQGLDQEGTGVYVLSSSSAVELSTELADAKYSAFTTPLIEALVTGAADFNCDGWVDANELYQYASSNIDQHQLQRPHRWNIGSVGDLRIARSGRVQESDGDGEGSPQDSRRQALLDQAIRGEVDDQVLCEALGFLRGETVAADATGADGLLGDLAAGDVSGAQFERGWTRPGLATPRAGSAVRVLSIDGGGIRALIPALVLAEIEQRTSKPIAELFDLVTGSSLSALLALGLGMSDEAGRPRWRAKDLVDIIASKAPHVFSQSVFHRIRSGQGVLAPRFDATALDELATTMFGESRLRDSLVPIIVPAYELERRQLFFFRSQRAAADPSYDFAMRDVARSASALPAYFQPARVQNDADGSTYVLSDAAPVLNNPAMAAYTEGEDFGGSVFMFSLGTGQETRPIRWEDARDWGFVSWLNPLLSMTGQGGADATDRQLSGLLGANQYVRLQTELDEASDNFDDASPTNIEALRASATKVIKGHDAEIDRAMASLVVAGSG